MDRQACSQGNSFWERINMGFQDLEAESMCLHISKRPQVYTDHHLKSRGFPGGSNGKESACSAGET